ncbi:Pre-rRNA-processing protein ipi3 [Allomyces javanicus]|nr:Pre-rRNA-processing protein ipi3 [Allomyces javanicus]
MREAFLAVTSADPLAALYDVHSGQTLHAFKPCTVPSAHAVAPLSSSIPHFAALQKDKGIIAVFSHDRDQPIAKWPLPEKLTCLASSASGRFLIAGAESGKAYVWDVASGTLLNVIEAHFQTVTVVRFSRDDRWVATASADAAVKVYELTTLVKGTVNPAHATPTSTCTPTHALPAHALPITDLHFSRTLGAHARLFTASLDHTVRVHDLATGTTLATVLYPAPVRCITTDPLDQALYVGADDGTVYHTPLVHMTTGASTVAAGGRTPFTTLADTRPTAVAVTPSGAAVLIGTTTGAVRAVDVASRTVVRSFAVGKAPVVHVHTSVLGEAHGPPQVATALARFLVPATDLVVFPERSEQVEPCLDLDALFAASVEYFQTQEVGEDAMTVDVDVESEENGVEEDEEDEEEEEESREEQLERQLAEVTAERDQLAGVYAKIKAFNQELWEQLVREGLRK